MTLLLDTHTLLWFVYGDRRLPRRAVAAIAGAPDVAVSAVTSYEITLKYSRGRLADAGAVAQDVGGTAVQQGFRLLPVELRHAEAAGRLPLHHRDPFDRLLAAQALLERLTLVSSDAAFDPYGVARLW